MEPNLTLTQPCSFAQNFQPVQGLPWCKFSLQSVHKLLTYRTYRHIGGRTAATHNTPYNSIRESRL